MRRRTPDFAKDRRLVLAAAFAGAGALATAPAWASPEQDAADKSLLEALCRITLPATDTPGAVETGVPAFIQLAMKHGLRGATPKLIRQVEALLDQTAGRAFLKLEAAQQTQALIRLDAATASVAGSPWRVMKGLILAGYYTSEIGASKELKYLPIPGVLQPNVPVTAATRALSTDSNARSGPTS